jgi:hypothetical protein
MSRKTKKKMEGKIKTTKELTANHEQLMKKLQKKESQTGKEEFDFLLEKTVKQR